MEGKREGPGPATTVVFVAEAHRLVVYVEKPMVRDRDSMRIASQVLKNVLQPARLRCRRYGCRLSPSKTTHVATPDPMRIGIWGLCGARWLSQYLLPVSPGACPFASRFPSP